MADAASFSCEVLVVGAGMAGIMAARRLNDQGREPMVVERKSKVGGRIETRSFGGAVFDTGPQFLTIRSDEFRAAMQPLIETGVLVEWSKGFPAADGRKEEGLHPRYRGSEGMAQITDRLSENVNVKLDAEVTSLNRSNDHWRVDTTAGSYEAGGVILTPPVKPALALLDRSPIELEERVRKSLQSFVYDPCLSLLTVLEGASRVPEPGGLRILHGPLRWITDNHLKGISPDRVGLTIHADASFSREWMVEDDETAASKILKEAEPWLNSPIEEWQLIRWKYSEPIENKSEEFRTVLKDPPLVLAGDAFLAPRIEGAALSGWSAAEELSKHMQ